MVRCISAVGQMVLAFVRCTHEMYDHKVHAHEVRARKMHTRKIHARESTPVRYTPIRCTLMSVAFSLRYEMSKDAEW
jgi:hypothetical protein